MSFLIDTNVLSEIRKGKNCDQNVRNWWVETDEDQIYLSVMVLGEIRRGIDRLLDRDPEKAQQLEHWLSAVLDGYRGRVIPIDENVANAWGSMTASKTIPLVDGLLAATARTHRITLVTRNVKDIKSLGVEYLNPFES